MIKTSKNPPNKLTSVGAVIGISVASLIFLPTVNAATLDGTFPGNTCTPQEDGGTTGTGADCEVTSNGSPLIVKFEFEFEGDEDLDPVITVDQIGSQFVGIIDGSEFDFTFDTQASGTWTYIPGPGDPATVVTNFTAKGGPNYNLFTIDNPLSDDWFTPNNPGGNPAGLSNFSFFDTPTNGGNGPTVPEPGTILGLLAVGGLGFATKLKKHA